MGLKSLVQQVSGTMFGKVYPWEGWKCL